MGSRRILHQKRGYSFIMEGKNLIILDSNDNELASIQNQNDLTLELNMFYDILQSQRHLGAIWFVLDILTDSDIYAKVA